MKTNTGECTVKINNLVILSKSLKPLPEKFHGLQDEEIRARKRYVDLIMNSESMNTFVLRSKIVSLIREYLNSLGYIEVETPILQSAHISLPPEGSHPEEPPHCRCSQCRNTP